ncbi:carboxymuconolactone decarboxylase family protein [Deinococcus sp. SM5_A1]|uniref:carboxymuconolactone decarboxylase family protein n=1 Tax=Deinococcus sp. SM5_A1 TaxID=3379094 RepID=UPI00385DBA38
MSQPYHLTLPQVEPEHAAPEAREVLERARKQVGRLPNMYLMMANSPALLETYLYGYDRFRKSSGFTPVEQEVVFLTLSRENVCEYCTSVHSFIADQMSKVPPEVTDAIRGDQEIQDAKLQALRTFTRAMHDTRGRPSEADAQAFFAAGYGEGHILDVILALSVKTISNYANHVFDTPLDETFSSREWRATPST